MKFSIYTIWIDYRFYIQLLIFLVSVLAFIYALKKLLFYQREEVQEEPDETTREESLSEEQHDILKGLEPENNEIKEQPDLFQDKKDESHTSLSPAEVFVKNIGDSLSSINERLARLESLQTSPKGKGEKNINEFVLKFLEDIVNDYDSLDKEKIKARIQFLISDLKK